eukprot:14848916-Alexandrium_andersonii.AAC.1
MAIRMRTIETKIMILSCDAFAACCSQYAFPGGSVPPDPRNAPLRRPAALVSARKSAPNPPNEGL